MLYDFTYQNPTRIHFGKNAINKLANELKAYGENILLIYGKAAIKKIDLYDQVIQILQAEGKTVVKLPGINRLEAFIAELGIPTTLREVGATEEMLPLIAHSTIPGGGYKQLTAEDILAILKACY